MSKIIINNKSAQTDELALRAVGLVVAKGEPYNLFTEYSLTTSLGHIGHITVVWHPNLASDRFSVYDSHWAATLNEGAY